MAGGATEKSLILVYLPLKSQLRHTHMSYVSELEHINACSYSVYNFL